MRKGGQSRLFFVTTFILLALIASYVTYHLISWSGPTLQNLNDHGNNKQEATSSNSWSKHKAVIAAKDIEISSLLQRLLELETRCNGSLAVGEIKQGEVAGGALEGRLSELEKALRTLKSSETETAPDQSGSQQKSVLLADQNMSTWKGYFCKASDADLTRFLSYDPRGICPDDWDLAQQLIFEQDCFSLPKRRCKNRTPHAIQTPLPFPASLFDEAAFQDQAVRWNFHACKSFDCLQHRPKGDCRGCFIWEVESKRWAVPEPNGIAMSQVLEMKKGRLRVGLDVGGGTGSFAAHMALHNCTILTTGFNRETVPMGGPGHGLPYMEMISLRGLVPLHLPHKARLPFYDNTLDIVHTMHATKYLPLIEFEEMLFDWDRVLRPDGVLWFENFYTQAEEMASYVDIIDALGYNKLLWNVTEKPGKPERAGPHVQLNCLLEKPERFDWK